MPTLEEMIDNMTDIHRAFVHSALDAFETRLGDLADYGVCVEDLDDPTLEQLIAESDALAEQSVAAAESAGRAVASRLYLQRTGDPRLPHTCRVLVQVRSVAEMEDGPCPECGRIGAHEGICAGPALEECEDNACDGCAWCDAEGITLAIGCAHCDAPAPGDGTATHARKAGWKDEGHPGYPAWRCPACMRALRGARGKVTR